MEENGIEENGILDNEQYEGAVELHPELVKQRQDTYSSLTDLNEVDVFFTEFENAVRQVASGRMQEMKALEGRMFDGQITVWEGADKELAEKLFTGQEENILRHDYTQDGNRLSFVDIGMVLIAMLGMSALYIFFFRDRKERKKKL